MIVNRLYYNLKPLIPRSFQLYLRRRWVAFRLPRSAEVWPIDPFSASKPTDWQGWPERKQFAFILTHDVDTAKGHNKCLDLMRIEKELGFRSSFNFVPKRYQVSETLRKTLQENGFEVGVHGLIHDGKLYANRRLFELRAIEINSVLQEWDAVGFRSPSMNCNLDWIHALQVQYDASTFDTDPFEPQPGGVHTIFPFTVQDDEGVGRYVELPYTLAQDFTLFILMQHTDIDVWKRKLDWLAEKGGMALVNVHPDYIGFDDNRLGIEEYSKSLYAKFLEYVKNRYKDRYWHALPREIAHFWKERE